METNTQELLMPREVDALFRWPRGRAQRLARAGKLRHVALPNGDIRFRNDDVAEIVNPNRPTRDRAGRRAECMVAAGGEIERR